MGMALPILAAALSASNSKNIYYADQLITSETPINPPDTEWVGQRVPNWIAGDKSYVAIATGEVGGKKYMVVLFQTTAEKNPDYKPNQNPEKN